MDAEQLTLPLDNDEVITLRWEALDMSTWCEDARQAAAKIVGEAPGRTWTGTRRELAIEVLKADASLWNAGLGKFWGPDMTGCDLAGLILEDPDLSGGDFSDSDFSSTEFCCLKASKTLFRGCKFDGADISTAHNHSVKADFFQSSFQHAALAGASFFNSKFLGCNFAHAEFKDVELEDCDMEGSNFSYCEVTDGSFDHTQLGRAVFERALLRGTKFDACDLAGANLYGAKLRDCDGLASALIATKGYINLRSASVDVYFHVHDEVVARAFSAFLAVLEKYE